MTGNQAVILVLGQSNASCHGPERANGGPNTRVFHQGSFLPAIDPMPGGSGSGGSVWTRLAPKMIDQGLCSEAIFVMAAYGGTAIADWVPGGSYHPRLIPILDSAADAGVEYTHVVWHQGERDTMLATSETAYSENMQKLIYFLRSRGIDAPIFVCQASYRFGVINQGVRAAQAGIVNPANGIYAGPDTDALGEDYRYDDTHLDAAGQDLFADRMLQAFVAAEGSQKTVATG